jgi:hypothetical protein
MKKILATNKTLLTRLTLPLLVLTGIALWLSRPFTWADIFLNLATDFITIIITVWYVNWVIRQQESTQWQEAEELIAAEAGRVGHGFINDVAESLKMLDQIGPSKDTPLHLRKLHDVQSEIITNVRRLDRDTIIERLDGLNPAQWQNFAARFRARSTEIGIFLSQFGSRLDPERLETLLELREAINAPIATYELFIRFLGVPLDQLPQVRDGASHNVAISALLRIGIDVWTALQKALDLIATFRYILKEKSLAEEELLRESWDKYWDKILSK